MQQTSLSDIEYANRRKQTRKDLFLDQMDRLVPWDRWFKRIRPFYPDGKRGRPPKDLELMLRMYLLQEWFRMSAEGTEDAVYDSYAMKLVLRTKLQRGHSIFRTSDLRYPELLRKVLCGKEHA